MRKYKIVEIDCFEYAIKYKIGLFSKWEFYTRIESGSPFNSGRKIATFKTKREAAEYVFEQGHVKLKELDDES